MGLFWEEEPKKSAKEKKTPPKKVWLESGYLPHFEQAYYCRYDTLTDAELVGLLGQSSRFLFDIESYVNYFLIAFKHIGTGKYLIFEITDDKELDHQKLKWVLENFTVIGFNSKNYDIPIATLAVAGLTREQLKNASSMLIEDDVKPQDLLKKFKAKKLKCDHIDLMEVAKGKCSLKLYGGRLHTEIIQDLPFPPDRVLNADEILVLKWYCIKGDLSVTEDLYNDLKPKIELREHMSIEYGVDLRSKSDAQIAESVIGKSLQQYTGMWPQKADIIPGSTFKYKVPSFLDYKTDLMKWVLDQVKSIDFTINEKGRVEKPAQLANLDISINKSLYRMRIGGLHSSEEVTSHRSDDDYIIVDRDVASYYPAIILNQGLYPKQLGDHFLHVYQSIVTRRLHAKKIKDTVTNECLKIVINGSFGKLGSPYSILYSPELLIQVTLTGQLSLLMLIERLELVGIEVISANTDGLVIKCLRSRYDEMDAICKQWEVDTQFNLEETQYKAIYSRDVNNYIAIKTDGKAKCKGTFATPNIEKNPNSYIITKAVTEFLTKSTPIEKTVMDCSDIKQFISLSKVAGGGVKIWENGKVDYLGKAVRWYYSKDVTGNIIYANSGDNVSLTEGARPFMKITSDFPTDLNYNYYIEQAYKTLTQVGYG